MFNGRRLNDGYFVRLSNQQCVYRGNLPYRLEWMHVICAMEPLKKNSSYPSNIYKEQIPIHALRYVSTCLKYPDCVLKGAWCIV